MEGETTNKSARQTPNSPLDEEELIARQFEIFEIKEGEESNLAIRQNKTLLIKILKELKRRKILVGQTMKNDYKILEYYKGSNQGTVFRVRSKSSFAKSASRCIESSNNMLEAIQCENQARYECLARAVKKIRINVTEKHKKYKDILILINLDHKNILKLEKIFFEYDKSSQIHYCNLVHPFIKYDFLSWLLNDENDRNHTQADIPKSKRRFHEICSILKQILLGLEYLHKNSISHLNLKFSNILIDENDNLYISDFGFYHSDQQNSSNNFAAPEALLYFNQKHAQTFQTKNNSLFFVPNFTQSPASPSPESRIMQYIPTTKADIYSFGILLYKIFVSESDKLDEESITEAKIGYRIQNLFLQDNEMVELDTIAGICDMIKICLSENPKNRPSSSKLLQEQKFLWNYSNFGSKKRKMRKISQDFGLENYYDEYIRKSHLQIFDQHKTAANSNNAESCFMMGQLLEDGQSGFQEPNLEMSAKYYFAAAEFKGSGFDADGLNNLGVLFTNGSGVTKNYTKAITCFEKASNLGLPIAFNNLGVMYECGWGVKQCYKTAIEMYHKAFQLGCEEGRTNILEINDFWDTNIPDNMDSVINLYIQAINNSGFHMQEDPTPITIKNFALFLKIGIIPDQSSCKLYFQLAADSGNIDSLYFLGQIFENEKNFDMAIKCYELAAQGGGDSEFDCVFENMNHSIFKVNPNPSDSRGQHESLFALGRIYETGRNGQVPPNLEKALSYYRKSKEQGNQSAREAFERISSKENCCIS